MREQPGSKKFVNAAATAAGTAPAASAVSDPSARSKFVAAAIEARPEKPFTIPRLELPAIMRLLPASQSQLIDAAVTAEMAKLDLELNRTTEFNHELERSTRYLAEAVIDPETDKPFATVDEWRSNIDADLMADCWRVYGDLRMMCDPASMPLDEDVIIEIQAAVKKNDPMWLRSFGASRLSSFLLTLASQLAISPIPRSGVSGSPSTPSSSPGASSGIDQVATLEASARELDRVASKT